MATCCQLLPQVAQITTSNSCRTCCNPHAARSLSMNSFLRGCVIWIYNLANTSWPAACSPCPSLSLGHAAEVSMTMSWACYCIIIDLKPIHQLADLTMTLFRLRLRFQLRLRLRLGTWLGLSLCSALHWVGRTNWFSLWVMIPNRKSQMDDLVAASVMVIFINQDQELKTKATGAVGEQEAN